MDKDGRQSGGPEPVAGNREPQRDSSPAPGKVTRTSRLSPSRGPAVQRKAAGPATGAEGPQARSAWDLTMDPSMDAAHRRPQTLTPARERRLTREANAAVTRFVRWANTNRRELPITAANFRVAVREVFERSEGIIAFADGGTPPKCVVGEAFISAVTRNPAYALPTVVHELWGTMSTASTPSQARSTASSSTTGPRRGCRGTPSRPMLDERPRSTRARTRRPRSTR
jgi:hypothetical protein